MTAVDEANSSLAIKCLDFCQALTSQGLEINFSLNIGSTFSFSLDTRHKVPLALDSKKKKKASPSTLRLAADTDLVLPAEVPRGSGMDLEDGSALLYAQS